MRNEIGILLALLLWHVPWADSGAAGSLQHEVEVRLDPARGTLEVVDRVTVSGRSRVVFGVDQGLMAPCSTLSESSGTTSSGSNSKRVPSPLQSAHMPCGLLKENACGVSSGNDR